MVWKRQERGKLLLLVTQKLGMTQKKLPALAHV